MKRRVPEEKKGCESACRMGMEIDGDVNGETV